MKPQTITELLAQPLAIAPAALLELKAAAMRSPVDAPEKQEPQPLQATLYTAANLSQVTTRDRQPSRSLVAVVPVSGLLSRHGVDTYDGTTPGMLQIERVMTELAANPAVGAIVMAVHSPGGTVTGTFELAQAIYEMRSQVRIVSVADSYMTSAAMAIGSAAHEVYSLPSGTVGSIGVIADLVSFARMYDRMGVDVRVLRSVPLKATANDMEPINEATVARLQELIDMNHSQFVDAMAKQRGVSVSHVNKHFGNGDTLTAQRAVDVGMIDGIVRGGVDQVIAMVASQIRSGRAA